MQKSISLLACYGLACCLLHGHAVAADGAAADTYAACRLPEMHILRDVGLGFPRIPNRLKTTGEVRITVLFTDFSDVPATGTPQETLAIISPHAEQFFNTVSYGKLHVSLEPGARWIRMRKPSTAYHSRRNDSFDAQRAYMQEAIDLAGAAVDYSHTDAVLVFANPAVKAIDYGPGFSPRPGFGLIAGGREIGNGATSGADLNVWGWRWFNHEFGHTMSLIDLAGPLPANPRLWYTYTGDFSLMGNIQGAAPEYLGWERWQLGWLEDNQVVCAGAAPVQTTLTPIERRGGTKMLVVPTGKTTAVIVESRRAEGYDSALPKAGPLVYTIDTRLSSHDGAIRVWPLDDTDSRHLQSPMAVGQTMQVGAVSISYLASDAQGDTIAVANKNQPE